MKKLYIVEYSTKCKRGSRRYRKLVESEDIESYINQNFLLGYFYARGAKMFISATEVRNVGIGKYVKADGGLHWYGHPITLFDYELKSNVQKSYKGEYFNSRLENVWSLTDDMSAA